MRYVCGFVKKTGASSDDSGQPPTDGSAPQPCGVETYSGYRLHEYPRRFTFQGEGLEVQRVLARWREPQSLGFIVAASDGRCYTLTYRPQRDAWEVLIHRGSKPSTE